MNFSLISAIQSANRAGPVLSCSAIRIYNSLGALTYRTTLVVCTRWRIRVWIYRIYVRSATWTFGIVSITSRWWPSWKILTTFIVGVSSERNREEYVYGPAHRSNANSTRSFFLHLAQSSVLLSEHFRRLVQHVISPSSVFIS